MSYPDEQIAELKGYCSTLSELSEGGISYLEMKDLRLPPGCTPAVCDALLCPATGELITPPTRLHGFSRLLRLSAAYPRW